jgi:hypothetical protein
LERQLRRWAIQWQGSTDKRCPRCLAYFACFRSLAPDRCSGWNRPRQLHHGQTELGGGGGGLAQARLRPGPYPPRHASRRDARASVGTHGGTSRSPVAFKRPLAEQGVVQNLVAPRRNRPGPSLSATRPAVDAAPDAIQVQGAVCLSEGGRVELLVRFGGRRLRGPGGLPGRRGRWRPWPNRVALSLICGDDGVLGPIPRRGRSGGVEQDVDRLPGGRGGQRPP